MDNSKITSKFSLTGKTARSFLPVGIIILASLTIIVYGITFNFTSVITEDEDSTNDNPEVLKLSEPQITREVTIGGLIRLSSGTIKRTYSGEPPSFCPT